MNRKKNYCSSGAFQVTPASYYAMNTCHVLFELCCEIWSLVQIYSLHLMVNYVREHRRPKFSTLTIINVFLRRRWNICSIRLWVQWIQQIQNNVLQIGECHASIHTKVINQRLITTGRWWTNTIQYPAIPYNLTFAVSVFTQLHSICSDIVHTVASIIHTVISVISCWSVLLVEETGVLGENHRPAGSHWQTVSHYFVSSTPRLSGIRAHIA